MIGDMEIQDIEPMKVLEVIRRFEERGAMERANKARRRCGEVFRDAIVTGRAKYNPSPDLADAMKGYRKKNYPFLPADQVQHLTRRWLVSQVASFQRWQHRFFSTLRSER